MKAMTVRELVDELEQLPDYYPVVVEVDTLDDPVDLDVDDEPREWIDVQKVNLGGSVAPTVVIHT